MEAAVRREAIPIGFGPQTFCRRALRGGFDYFGGV